MKSLRYLSLGIILCLALSIFAGCGNKVSEEDLSAAVEAKDISQLTELINTYQEQSNKSDLDEKLIESITGLTESGTYDDFTYAEKLAESLPEEGLKDKAAAVIEDHYANKVMAFTKGKWVRRDYTNCDGMVIDLKWTDEEGTAVVTSVKVKNNEDGYKENDIKWKSVKAISQNELTFEDLWRNGSDSEPEYKQGYAEIDYDNNQLICSITSESNDEYARGNKQVLIKNDNLDADKGILTEDDFNIMDEESWAENDDLYFEFSIDNDLIKDEKLRKKVEKMAKEDPEENIEDGDLIKGMGEHNITRERVIEKYGYGHIVYQDPKNDEVYKTMNEFVSEDSSDYMCAGVAALIEQSEYAAIYDTKKKDKHMKMYFNEKGKLLAVICYKFDAFTP